MKEFLKKFMAMDRRYVFLGVAIFTVVPLLSEWELPIIVREEVQTVFDEIDKCGPDGKPMILSFDFDPGTNVVDVHVRRLRLKVDEGRKVRLIHTVRGVGYVLKP